MRYKNLAKPEVGNSCYGVIPLPLADRPLLSIKKQQQISVRHVLR